jgi:hypothetical protein
MLEHTGTYVPFRSFPCSLECLEGLEVDILRKVSESEVGGLQHGGYDGGCNEAAER